MKAKLDLTRLTDQDMTTLLLFSLYKLQNNPKYATLSSLAFLLDKETLVKFLGLYGGLDIRVPTLQEFQLLVNALRIYNNVNLEGRDISSVSSAIIKANPAIDKKVLMETYVRVCDILKDYSVEDARVKGLD